MNVGDSVRILIGPNKNMIGKIDQIIEKPERLYFVVYQETENAYRTNEISLMPAIKGPRLYAGKHKKYFPGGDSITPRV